ncbi:MAG: class I SAM-dependent methyltransferase [Lachnospiraceae bacterium]|nr:class I SAM-dependent methyltransferase [Lachnospiraceae bacterium]
MCPECGCLQIAIVPDNLGDYYGEGYYSFSLPADPNKKYAAPATHHEKILDAGCGSGVWLNQLAEQGYDNLFGCDPFLSHEVRHGDRVYIKTCTIHEMDGKGTFNLVHFGDSFEHVTDPLETLQSAAGLICDDGLIEMTIPTYPNVAFELFGPHWYQLDAPRHIFLHSRASIEYLADKSGLQVEKYVYNSNETQMFRSFFYQHGVPFYEITGELTSRFFGDEQLKEFTEKSEECNRKGFGDHMTVYLSKK